MSRDVKLKYEENVIQKSEKNFDRKIFSVYFG